KPWTANIESCGEAMRRAAISQTPKARCPFPDRLATSGAQGATAVVSGVARSYDEVPYGRRRSPMKTKLLVLVAFTALVAFAVQVGTAVAGSHTHAAFADITSDLRLRPGVAQFGGHPRVNPAGRYGAFDATYVPRTGKMAYN